jgi:hypothetical protein
LLANVLERKGKRSYSQKLLLRLAAAGGGIVVETRGEHSQIFIDRKATEMPALRKYVTATIEAYHELRRRPERHASRASTTFAVS